MRLNNSVWVIDDDRSIRWVLERALKRAGISVMVFESAAGMMEKLASEQPNAIVSDIRMPGMDGMEFLGQVVENYPDLPVIIMTAYSDLDSAVSAYQGGAFEYLPKPFDVDEAVSLVERAMAHSATIKGNSEPTVAAREKDIIGSAPAMQEVFRAIGRLSNSHITVLVTGESGTGKELVAKALHRHGPRHDKPFIALNTAAIPKDLLESELFGHDRGAFTSAQSMRRGRFEQAHNGTLFLDEIGDMPAELQTRLLRVLADGTFYRVGGHTPLRVDVRIIAATHQNLEERVAQGAFREDLFHRLNVIRVHTPALRDRREDIPELMRYFLDKSAAELAVESKTLHPEAAVLLEGLPWPGNVRQLENTCRWLTVMASGSRILVSDLPPELVVQAEVPGGNDDDWESLIMRWAQRKLVAGEWPILDEALPKFEKIMIDAALRHTGGRRQEAARILGWGRNTLTRKIREHGMSYTPVED